MRYNDRVFVLRSNGNTTEDIDFKVRARQFGGTTRYVTWETVNPWAGVQAVKVHNRHIAEFESSHHKTLFVLANSDRFVESSLPMEFDYWCD